MKAIPCLRTLCRASAVLFLAQTLAAQTVAPVAEPVAPPERIVTPQPAPATATGASDPEIVVLSPFTVSSEKESGYMATETLAGMRLRTDLKDVGAAIDVLTEQFLNDVGAIDVVDALKHVTNMSQFDFGDEDLGNDSQWHSFAFNSRGIKGTTILTDFFDIGAVPIDRYNTENLTFLRGPNAILFGIGTPSGVIGSSTKRASLSKNSTTLRLMFDNFGSRRFDFDSDQTLVRGRFGIRVAGVLSDKSSFMEPAKNERNSLFFATTYRPFRKTRISANLEWGEWNRLNINNLMVADHYTPWVNAGRPTVNFVTGEGGKGWVATETADVRKTKFDKSAGSGLEAGAGSVYLVYIEGSGLPIMDWRQMPRGASYGKAPGTSGMRTSDITRMDSIPFTKDNAIIDLDANIWGEMNAQDFEYNRQSVFVEQGLAPGLDLELAANRAMTTYFFNFFSNNYAIYVDPSEVLPDGSPNPYVGMPYIETGNTNSPRHIRDRQEFLTYRATLSYELNLDKYKIFKNVGLGNYRFAGLYQHQEYEKKYAISSQYINVAPETGKSFDNNILRLSRRYYLNPGESTFKYDGRYPAPQTDTPGAFANTNWPVTMQETSIQYGSPGNNLRYQQTRVESLVFAAQGSWWQSRDGWPHLTALFGMRRDERKDRRMVFPVDSVTNLQPNKPASIDGLDALGKWPKWENFTANTKSYNITFRPISALRFFYNYSDIYVASNVINNVDFFGKSLRPNMGETQDYGVKIDLFKGRVYVTATKFKTGSVDGWFTNTSNIVTPLNKIYNSLADGQKYYLNAPCSYQDDTTYGYEFRIDLKLARNWDVRIGIGTQDAKLDGRLDDVVAYFDHMAPYWAQHADEPLTVPTSTYSDVKGAVADARRVLNDFRAVIGRRPTSMRQYNVKFNTGYNFPRNFLKGLRVSAGLRWDSANYLGYANDPNSSIGEIDVNRPFRGKDMMTTNASIAYSRKLFRNKLDWTVQLYIENVLNDHDPDIRQAVDDGSGNPLNVRYTSVAPISFQLTNSFKF